MSDVRKLWLLFWEMFKIALCVVGGGFAILAVADEVWMLENATYSILSPEGFASILWKDAAHVAEAAQCLRITAEDMLEFHVADGIFTENFSDFPQMCAVIRERLSSELETLCALPTEELREQRYRRFRRIGVYEENGCVMRFPNV